MYSKESINTSAEAILPRYNKASLVPAEPEQAKLYQKERKRAKN